MSREKENTMDNSRRNFLKTAALAGVAISASPLLNTVSAAQRITGEDSANTSGKIDLPLVKSRRTLGTGRFAMEVSAMGFGCMGTTEASIRTKNRL